MATPREACYLLGGGEQGGVFRFFEVIVAF